MDCGLAITERGLCGNATTKRTSLALAGECESVWYGFFFWFTLFACVYLVNCKVMVLLLTS